MDRAEVTFAVLAMAGRCDLDKVRVQYVHETTDDEGCPVTVVKAVARKRPTCETVQIEITRSLAEES